jgi:hypothetical protein
MSVDGRRQLRASARRRLVADCYKIRKGTIITPDSTYKLMKKGDKVTEIIVSTR